MSRIWKKISAVFLIAVMTICMIPGLTLMSGMSKAYAAGPEHISGNVNVSDMIENTDYVLDGDTALYIDADLDIFSIDMDSYDLTITGDGTHVLNVQGIRGTNSVLEMQSGMIEMNFGSNEAPYAAISLEGPLSEFKMTGGQMDISYTCMSDSANTVSGIDVGQFTMTGGDLDVYALVDEAASCRGLQFNEGFNMTGGKAKFVGETFESSRSGYGICADGYVDLNMTGGELTAEGYTSGNESYGMGLYNMTRSNVFSGGTVRTKGQRNGIFAWGSIIIKNGVQLYANAEDGDVIETDEAEIDISGEGTYVLAESKGENVNAIEAYGSYLTIDSTTLKIIYPPGGHVSGYYVADADGQSAPKVEIGDANTYKLTATCWDTRDNCAITEDVSVIVNSDSFVGSYTGMVPGGSSFTLGIDNNSGGDYVFLGWAKGSPDGAVIGGGAESINQTMPGEDVTYYALFDNTSDIVIHSLTFTAYTEPTAGDLSVKPVVTAAEEGVTVNLIRWLDSSQSNIGFNHEFVSGETVYLVFRYNVAEGYTLAPDITEHITVNGEAPDDVAPQINSLMKKFVVRTGTEYIPNSFNITYDESKAFPTTRLSGHHVSLHLLRSVTSNPGDSLDGRGWLVYDADPDKTGYTASRWTCLVKRDGNRYVALYDSDELLNTEDEYFFCFNIEDKDDDDILPFDMSRPFYITVNGEPADEVQTSGESNGDLYVYKRVELNETDDLVWSLDVKPEDANVKRGTSRQFTATFHASTNESVIWSVSDNSSPGTYMTPEGELFVSTEEELGFVNVTATSAVDYNISDTVSVHIVDYVPSIDSVSVIADRPVVCRGTGVDFYATIEGTESHDLTWELLGSDGTSYFNSGSNTDRHLLVGSEETAESLTVRATSVADPSKYGEATIQLKDKEVITGPINITFDESKVSLVDDHGNALTGKQVTQAFREAITCTYGTDLSEEDAPGGWFVYGDVSPEPHYEYTSLVYKYGEDGYKSLYNSDETLDRDREYFLWFNIEETYLTRYFDKTMDLADLNITVNGKPVNGKDIRAKWGGKIEVRVRITFPAVIDRIAGSNRYQTAFDTADRLKTELAVARFPAVVIASGSDFPDALAGAYLAKVKDAPILLTDAARAPTVAQYVKDNMEEWGTVYILGGEGAVPTAMEEALESLGITKVERLAGSNRYATNIEILRAAGVAGEDLLVCSGKGYADSLSASAVGKPILLVADSLTPVQAEYLEEISGSTSGNIYAIGGTGAVSDTVFEQVATALHGGSVPSWAEIERIYGSNRYTTSTAVAGKFFPDHVERVFMAYAMNYPDGLAGGPLAYACDAPLLLVTNSNYRPAKEYAAGAGAFRGTIMGGQTLISDDVAISILTN